VKLWNDLRGWIAAKAAVLRLCLRMTVAGILAYVLAKLFALPEGSWAVITAIIVMQASVGGSVAAHMLGHLADLLGAWLDVLAGSGDRACIAQLQDDIRAGMARLEIAAGEARQERGTYITRFDADPLVRTVFRLRDDLIMIGRAAAEPLPETIVAPLRDPLGHVSEAAQGFLRMCGKALRERKNPPSLDAVEQALANLIEALRREGAMRKLCAEGIGRLFTLGFALEQLRQNFEDFRNRVAECARADEVIE
jgi:uncharacterized membrane protein YccC